MRLPFFLTIEWWKRRFDTQGKPSGGAPLTNLYKHLDMQLVNQMRSRGIPSWTQLCHLPQFLSAREKILLRVLTSVAGVGILLLAARFAIVHHTTRPAQGGEYIEGVIGSPSLVNPLFSSLNQVDADLVKLTYQGLFRFDEHLNLEPALADRYELSNDGKTYHIFLKDNLKWSDGEPLTVDDVQFTIERIQDTATLSPLIFLLKNVSFDKINDREFTLTLKEPYAPFIHFLTVGILPAHIWQETESANMRLSSVNLKPVGSGPYTVSALTKDETGIIRSYTLKPNDYFFLQKPFISKLTFKFFPDINSALDALKTHQINGLGHIPSALLNKINTKTDTVLSLKTNQYAALFFNPSFQPILKDKQVRLALAHAINRPGIADKALDSQANLVNGPLLQEMFSFLDPNPDAETYNIQESDTLLSSAGWSKISPDQYVQSAANAALADWVKKNPSPTLTRRPTRGERAAYNEQEAQWGKNKQDAQTQFTQNAQDASTHQQFFWEKNKTVLSFTLTVPQQDEYQKIANLIINDWRAIGVDVRVELADTNRMRSDTLKNKHYDALLYSVLLSNDADPYPVWHSSQIKIEGLNLAAFSNKQADMLLEKARSASSPEERRALYEKFQALLETEMPAVFLYSPRFLYVLQSDVKGTPSTGRLYTPDDRFNTIASWFTKTRWGWK